jgi:hypothetical protein
MEPNGPGLAMLSADRAVAVTFLRVITAGAVIPEPGKGWIVSSVSAPCCVSAAYPLAKPGKPT